MRTAFATLILAAGLTTAAQAQTAATPPATPVQPATQPAAPAPGGMAAPQTTPAPTASPTTPDQPAPAAPPAPTAAGVAAAPATPGAPGTAAATPPAPPPPTLPTTGDGAAMIDVLQNVCIPLVHGGDLKQIAKAQGYRYNRRDMTWTKPLGGERQYTVTVEDPGVNKDTCTVDIHFAIGGEQPIVDGLNVWAALHNPQLFLLNNDVSTWGDGTKRVRRSWRAQSSTQTIGLAFTTIRHADDSPLNRNYDTAQLMYQERGS